MRIAQTFETAIIERYRRRESSVEEALIEMYLAGVSVRRVEDITEALWGTRVSPSTVSDLNKKIYATIDAWRNRPIEGEHPYVYLDGIVLKRSWAGEVRNVSLLVAIGVNNEGYREILGICEGAKEDKAGWSSFLKHLKERGLAGVRLIISDACLTGTATSSATCPRPKCRRSRPCSSQGDPRQRGHCGGERKGCPSCREVGGAAADQGRRARGRGGRRNADLLRLPGGALAAHPHEQSALRRAKNHHTALRLRAKACLNR